MRRRAAPLRIFFLAVILALPGLTRARTLAREPLPPPDLLVVVGHDPELVLPATLIAALGHPAPPLLLIDLERTKIAAAFIKRFAPASPLLITPRDMNPGKVRRLCSALGLPGSARLGGDFRKVSDDLLAHRPTRPSLEGPWYVVEEGDLEAALVATYAAGRTRGWLLFVPAGVKPRSLPPHVFVGRLARRPGLPPESRRFEDPAALAHSLRPDPPGPEGRRLVLANVADTRGHFSPPHLSLLAPLVALRQGAELHLVDDDPETVRRLVAERDPHTVTLVADILGIEQTEVEDPDDRHQGRDPVRRFALPNLTGLTPTTATDPADLAPAEIAVGRLAALDVFDLSLQLARQRASELGRWPRSDRALMLANVDLKFRLGEVISRATVHELEAAGYTVDARYGAAVEKARKAGVLPGHDLVVWEGHPRDLGVDGNLGLRSELLDARLVILQGCYTLERNDAYALGALGAESVLGTTMPVYSASGSALAKVFLDAQLQQGATQGEALVHARNFTLAYLRLKQKRGQKQWRKTWRAGLAFDLWGDPTARPLERSAGSPPWPAVRLLREGETLRFEVPAERYPKVESEGYEASIHPGGQLGSLVSRRKKTPGSPRRVQEVYFGWIELPEQIEEKGPPRLRTELEDRDWALVWAPRARRLYLLVHGKVKKAPTFRILH